MSQWAHLGTFRLIAIIFYTNISLPQMPILYCGFFFFQKNLIGIFNAFFCGGWEWAAFPFASKNSQKENNV